MDAYTSVCFSLLLAVVRGDPAGTQVPVEFSAACTGEPVTVESDTCVCFEAGAYDWKDCTTSGTFTLDIPHCLQIPGYRTQISANTHFYADAPDPPFPRCFQPVDENEDGGRKKRAAPIQANVTDPMDEDFSTAGGKEIGHELMRNQMNMYIESVIAKLTGMQGEAAVTGGGMAQQATIKYPVIKLLDLCRKIMQRVCHMVNADFFDLALNSFVNLQLETFHVKEPYIGYSAFKRIQQALESCLRHSQTYQMVEDRFMNLNLSYQEDCEYRHEYTRTPLKNKTVTDIGDDWLEGEETMHIPAHGKSVINGTSIIAEPMIETVWKMLITAHSQCYMHFSEYFNDHHTLTVSLLPLFTNQIQDIWLKGYDVGSNDTKLYGGLLGNINQIMDYVDRCAGTARMYSPYPWFMSRPPRDKSNVWRRKKRDTESMFQDETTPPFTCDHKQVHSNRGRLCPAVTEFVANSV